MLKLIIAPILSAFMLSQPSNFAFNVKKICDEPNQKNFSQLFDFSLLEKVVGETLTLKKAVTARNQRLAQILAEIDG